MKKKINITQMNQIVQNKMAAIYPTKSTITINLNGLNTIVKRK